MNEYEKMFNEKINYFSKHEKYETLRKNADKALNLNNGFGYESIVAADFMDRIIAMPLDYIQDWLDGKNKLEWRQEDEKMLNAIKGNWIGLLKQNPDAEIHQISSNSAEFYKVCGFKIILYDNRTFAVK